MFEPKVIGRHDTVVFVDVDGVLARDGQRVFVDKLQHNQRAFEVLNYVAAGAGVVVATSRVWGSETREAVDGWLFSRLRAEARTHHAGYIGTPTSLPRHNAKEACVSSWLRRALAQNAMPRRWLIIDDQISPQRSELVHDNRAYVLAPDPRRTLAGVPSHLIERARDHLLGVRRDD